MTPERYTRLTRFSLWALTIIVVSGGAVRLTGSGLGCPDWPMCEQDQLFSDLEYHGLVENVNRMFTGVVSVAVILAVVGSLRRRPRRGDLTAWSLGLVAGVLAQIVLGGLLVLADLDPRFTMGHFLVSMVLIWNAVVLEHRSLVTDPDRRRLVADPRTRGLVRLVSLAGAAVLVAGTVVTGAGPHAGDDRAARLPFLVRDVARVHSITAIGLLALVAYTGHRLDRADHQGAELRARTLRIGGLLVVQGAVGYTQYLTGVPVLLVGVHLALASLTWIEIVRLHLAIRVDMSPSVADVGSRPLATT